MSASYHFQKLINKVIYKENMVFICQKLCKENMTLSDFNLLFYQRGCSIRLTLDACIP